MVQFKDEAVEIVGDVDAEAEKNSVLFTLLEMPKSEVRDRAIKQADIPL